MTNALMTNGLSQWNVKMSGYGFNGDGLVFSVFSLVGASAAAMLYSKAIVSRKSEIRSFLSKKHSMEVRFKNTSA